MNKTSLGVPLGEGLKFSVAEKNEFHGVSSFNRSQRNYLI
ncbi:hypothetical protein ARZXY2_3018 [Arthrobacter sp. ZXY-2]|nr:hypothetical protein ARZXY2_3018 [Arthrobacter sp. ZXY-2]